jgi:hypothetical protein
VPRRVSLPGADELFRRTSESQRAGSAGAEARHDDGPATLRPADRVRPTLAPAPAPPDEAAEDAEATEVTEVTEVTEAAGATDTQAGETQRETRQGPTRPQPARDQRPAARPERPRRTASGRVRHDEKMTVYVTADELLELEQARLVLRRELGSAVDRGRLVRAAVAMALADLDEHGADGELVRRLRDS